MCDNAMVTYLTDMGHDVMYPDEADRVDVALLCELAMLEGFKWNDDKEVWEQSITHHLNTNVF